MKIKRNTVASLVTLILLAVAFATQAATNYWDNNGATPGFGVAGGTWGVDQNWNTNSTGGSVPDTTSTTTADDLHFGVGSNGLATGMILVDGTNGFRSLNCSAASGDIMFSGGTLELATPTAHVIAENASNTIESLLTGDSALHKFGTLTYTSFLTTNAATIFPNTTLADYSGVDGTVGGAFVGGGGDAIPGDAFFFTNNVTNATYQLQVLDGQWTKCVKVELAQSGPDVLGRAVYAKYINNGRQLGYNFDTTNANNQVVATSFAAAGYGASETILTTDINYSLFLPAAPATTTIVYNASLADCIGADGVMGGASISGLAAPADAYFFTRSSSNITYQLQCFNGGYTKCVKIELTQAGTDIQAKVLYAKYYNDLNVDHLGFDFESGGTPNTIVTSYAQGGYGAAKTVLTTFNEGSVLTLTGDNAYEGHTLAGGGPLVIGGAGQLGSGSYTGMIFNSGGFRYESSEHQALSGPISSVGSLTKGIAADYASTNHPHFLTGSAMTIFTNAALSNYVGAAGIMGGAAIYHSRPFVADAYHFTNDGSIATVQLQVYDGGHTKCVKIELTQVDTNIAGRVVYAKYLGSQDSRGFDFDTGGTGNGIATAWTAGGYGAAETTLMTHPNSKLTLTAANTYAGGTVVHAGVLHAMANSQALPSSGSITVGQNAELRLDAPGLPFNSWGGIGNGTPITVNGGILTLSKAFNAGYGRQITLNGGLLRSMDTAWEDGGDNANYMNNLTLRDGAQVIGHPIRVGLHSAATITVGGTNASSLAAGIRLVNGGNRPLTLDVADVTGDTNTDFTISGVMWDYVGYVGMPVVKTGAGTVVFSGTNTHSGTTTLTEGTLVFGADDTLAGANAIVLNGGVLDMGAFENTLGTLTVATTNSQIVLGDGQLAFADSSAMAWTNRLTLVGALGPETVRFGTNDMALTRAQLESIRIGEAAPGIDPDGYLTLREPGMTIFVR